MTKSNFKLLILLNLLLWIPSFMAMSYVFDSLPPELNAFLEDNSNDNANLYDSIMVLVGLATLIASVGIIFFKNWARHIFTFGTFFTTAGMIFHGPVIHTPVESAILEVSLVLNGIIIGMMYFSPVSVEYKN